jgi:hypothetical protein
MGCINTKCFKNDKNVYKVDANVKTDISGNKPNIQMTILKKQPTDKFLLNESDLDKMEEVIQADADSQMKLQHIIESIYDAAVKAHNNVQINSLHTLFWLLPANEHGVHIPKCIPIQVPDDTNNDGNSHKIVNVPIITLINQQNLNINELKIKTEVDMELESIPKVDCNNQNPYNIKKKDYSLRLVPGDKSTQIEMTIKMDPPLEIYNRILSKLEKQL